MYVYAIKFHVYPSINIYFTRATDVSAVSRDRLTLSVWLSSLDRATSTSIPWYGKLFFTIAYP